MKRSFLIGISILFFCSLVTERVDCQITNDGGTIVIGPGSKITCSGIFINQNSGIVTNNGQLEVRSSFLNNNNAIYSTNTADDSLIFSGTGNVSFLGGTSSFTNVWINKTNPSDYVNLATSVIVNNKLKYDQGVLNTGAFVLSSPVSAIYEFQTGKEIFGTVKRTNWVNGSTVSFNQPNMTITTNGGSAPTDFSVSMIPSGDPTDNEREVKRYFSFQRTGGSLFTTNIKFPYLDPELNTNLEANLFPWQRIVGAPTEWNVKSSPVTRDGGLNYVSVTGIPTTELSNEWKLADSKYSFNVSANLRGAWGAGNMNSTINSILPLAQPYSAAPFAYAGTESVSAGFFTTHSSIVDWVLVQFRKPASGLAANATEATEIGTKAAFILQNGSIVDLDGVTPLTMDLKKQGAGFFVIRHRNHIAVMSNSLPSNATGTYSADFRILSTAYINPGITNQPLTLLPGSTQYGLWAGNADGDPSIGNADLSLVVQRANLSSTGYEQADVNMDGGVNGSDLFLTKKGVLQTILTHSSRTTGNRILQTHVPY